MGLLLDLLRRRLSVEWRMGRGMSGLEIRCRVVAQITGVLEGLGRRCSEECSLVQRISQYSYSYVRCDSAVCNEDRISFGCEDRN